LPISPGEVTALGMAAITNYQNNFNFSVAALQGDVATAKYGGETFASKNIALWVDSNLGTTEDNIELEPPIDSTSGTETFSLIVAVPSALSSEIQRRNIGRGRDYPVTAQR